MNLPQPNPYAQAGGQSQGPRLQELRPYPGVLHGQTSQFYSPGQPGYPPPHPQPPPIHSGPVEQPLQQFTHAKQIPSIGSVLPERGGYPPSSYGVEEQHRNYAGSSTTMYHSHPLPGHPDEDAASSETTRGRKRNNPVHVSVVGGSRFPSPAPRREERARFTSDDDRKLKQLKENHELTWRQIEEFFPGRQSGTLQVRYCTKLKDRQEISWTQAHDQRLRGYLRDYETTKWKFIAQKMGHNFTPQACEERARDLEAVLEPPGDEAYL